MINLIVKKIFLNDSGIKESSKVVVVFKHNVDIKILHIFFLNKPSLNKPSLRTFKSAFKNQLKINKKVKIKLKKGIIELTPIIKRRRENSDRENSDRGNSDRGKVKFAMYKI